MIFLGIIVLIAVLAAAVLIFLQLPRFGALPSGDRLKTLEGSSAYGDGKFHNQEPAPMNFGRGGALGAWMNFLLAKRERPAPSAPLPSLKADIKALDPAQDTVLWLGHSSFYIQLAGRRLLLDPVFSLDAAPLPFANRAFAGSNIFSAADMPAIDYLLITHDHWDHLDYPTVMALRDKLGTVICPLGVGAHFERWGFAPEKIIEGDWGQKLSLTDDLSVHVLRARHFSGRSLTRDKALWAAYALIAPKKSIYISGDSGYGAHFSEAGTSFGGFDLALLDSGQYNEAWPHVHMNPEESAKAALDLRARALIPAHVGKFCIAYHSWDEPFVRLEAASRDKDYRLLTPMIGQAVALDDLEQRFEHWWLPLSRAERGLAED